MESTELVAKYNDLFATPVPQQTFSGVYISAPTVVTSGEQTFRELVRIYRTPPAYDRYGVWFAGANDAYVVLRGHQVSLEFGSYCCIEEGNDLRSMRLDLTDAQARAIYESLQRYYEGEAQP